MAPRIQLKCKAKQKIIVLNIYLLQLAIMAVPVCFRILFLTLPECVK